MVWLADAERELKKIPFFVRGKARRNTEAYAAERGVSRSASTPFTKRRPILRGDGDHIPGYRVVIVTLDSHAAGPAARVSERLSGEFPGLNVTVHAAAEWAENPPRWRKRGGGAPRRHRHREPAVHRGAHHRDPARSAGAPRPIATR
jgi:hypothetical protein